jgi:hypothetical protein
MPRKTTDSKKNAQQEDKKVQQSKPAQQEEKKAQEDKNVQQEKPAQPEEKKAQQQEEKKPQQEKPAVQHEQQAQRASGNHGRIPDDRYKAKFGREHTFRATQGDFNNHRFQYGGYGFGFAAPLAEQLAPHARRFRGRRGRRVLPLQLDVSRRQC